MDQISDHGCKAGEGFTIHTQKDDIWERMSEPELERLEGIISREALYFKYHDKIAGASRQRRTLHH